MKSLIVLALLSFGLLAGLSAQPTSQTVVAVGATWKFLNQNGDQGTVWRTETFNDASWSVGPSPLGYSPNNSDAASTTICNGCSGCTCTDCAPDCNTKRITTYFRHTVNLSDVTGTFSIRYQRDDGIVIYVNGTEVHRENLPEAPATITYSTTATAIPSDDEERAWKTVTMNPSSLFHTGNNVIAAEIHQTSASSSDIRFNMEVTFTPVATPLVRGPYLQMGTPHEMTLRWRTSTVSTGRVRYWTTEPGSQTFTADETSATTEHEKRLTGLTPSTRYFYTIGATDGSVLQGTPDNYFYTSPPLGIPEKTRIWLIGDFGTGGARQIDVKNGFKTFAGSEYIDMWIWLGDNAYSAGGTRDGRDSVYQLNVFNVYGPDRFMRQTPFYATPGNHDYYSTEARRIDHAIDYFNIVSNFRGGAGNDKEEYYSFNHGNIHIVSLDSYGYESGQGTAIFAPAGPQMTWLRADLEAAKANPAITWTLVFLHHPPYTNGTHDSDSEAELTNIRQQLVPILDQYRVDLLIGGHSHVYERTKLIKGHTGPSSTFDPNVHNAPPANNEPTPNFYYKNRMAPTNEGVMYIVNGTGGAAGKGSIPQHPAMDVSLDEGGSLYLEVEGNQLIGKFIGLNGAVKDEFTMIKTESVANTTNTLLGTDAGASLNTESQQNTLVGYQAGYHTTSSANLMFGYKAGYNNTTGNFNTFLGVQAGLSNTTGSANYIMGTNAGVANTTGSGNYFLGDNAGSGNTTGGFNIYIGANAASGAGVNGDNNLAIGFESGRANVGGFNNTFLGFRADAGANNLTNATAIGNNARVNQSNSIVLGNSANVGIGTSTPQNRLEIVGANNAGGLRITNLRSTTPATLLNQTKFLTVNANGDVVLGSINNSARATSLLWEQQGNNLRNVNAGSVIIGEGISRMPADYNLFVSKGILTQKVKVAVRNTADWSDRVFEDAYHLRPLPEVEQYVRTNRHLPGIPSAEQVVSQGIDLAWINAKLLEKIEELTLYVVQLEKNSRKLGAENAHLQQQITKLNAFAQRQAQLERRVRLLTQPPSAAKPK
ncbi:hypothetical protein HNV11_03280 [Spirosoma taeanense]|uniref:Fibronectin type-III domain-containing protein n=1 Tax=Spirosoma taeanense TaxID=2735870 RepID=A0A6M5Y5X6_9BACT|nr:metallophosphoesterase [Spirosoma taeanense]QJW88463.1 hypothetical protein HNV11_03280 [Spirosoma taeanense]